MATDWWCTKACPTILQADPNPAKFHRTHVARKESASGWDLRRRNLVDNCELHQFIDNAFMTEESHPVVAMQKFSKGFFVASDHGEIAMYVRSEENNTSTGKNPYDWIRTCLPA